MGSKGGGEVVVSSVCLDRTERTPVGFRIWRDIPKPHNVLHLDPFDKFEESATPDTANRTEKGPHPGR